MKKLTLEILKGKWTNISIQGGKLEEIEKNRRWLTSGIWFSMSSSWVSIEAIEVEDGIFNVNINNCQWKTTNQNLQKCSAKSSMNPQKRSCTLNALILQKHLPAPDARPTVAMEFNL